MNTQQTVDESARAQTAQTHAQGAPTTDDAHDADDADEAVRAAVDSARSTVDAATVLARSATASARAGRVAVRQQLEQRPYVTLGIVAGIGFVAAGGLASPIFGGLARLGARAALAFATRKIAEAALTRATAGTTENVSPDSGASPGVGQS